jgi:hypothetical protein
VGAARSTRSPSPRALTRRFKRAPAAPPGISPGNAAMIFTRRADSVDRSQRTPRPARPARPPPCVTIVNKGCQYRPHADLPKRCQPNLRECNKNGVTGSALLYE